MRRKSFSSGVFDMIPATASLSAPVV